MKAQKLITTKSILVAALLPLFAGCAATAEVDAPAPPPDQVEVVPAAPEPNYIWVGGSWEWNGGWVWERGHWALPPHQGAVWIHGTWRGGRHGHRVWVHSHWN